MSNTNDILKSLAELQKSLEEINSAKEQVIKVVDSSEALAKAIESYKSSFEGLSANVQTILEESKSFSIETITKLSEQTDNFNKEVTRLIEFDFIKSFQSIEQEVVKTFEKDLSEKLAVIDSKSQNLQEKVDDMQKQIVRFESIDLEAHFAKHQKTLSEIFTAINAVNLTLTNITQSLTTITQGLGTISVAIESCKTEIFDKLEKISNVIDTSKKEIISKQNDFKNELNTRLNNIESDLKNKFSEIENQNTTLLKSLKNNRLILICSIVVVIGLLVFNIFVK